MVKAIEGGDDYTWISCYSYSVPQLLLSAAAGRTTLETDVRIGLQLRVNSSPHRCVPNQTGPEFTVLIGPQGVVVPGLVWFCVGAQQR